MKIDNMKVKTVSGTKYDDLYYYVIDDKHPWFNIKGLHKIDTNKVIFRTFSDKIEVDFDIIPEVSPASEDDIKSFFRILSAENNL